MIPFIVNFSRLSVGSILLFLLFAILSLYFLVGVLYRKCYRRHSGYEILPNHDFWVDLPFLIRDGYMYMVRGCQVEPFYDQI
ncbi:unnamed protein product [Gordionus sp. m RMFG-2023]